MTASSADKKVIAEIRKLRKAGAKWGEVAKKVGLGQSKCQEILERADVKPADRITLTGDDAKDGKLIVKLRDKDNVSWGLIAARAEVSNSKIKALYRSATGVEELPAKSNYASKPGPKREGGGEAATKAEPAKAEPAKKSSAKKRPKRRRKAPAATPAAETPAAADANPS